MFRERQAWRTLFVSCFLLRQSHSLISFSTSIIHSSMSQFISSRGCIFFSAPSLSVMARAVEGSVPAAARAAQQARDGGAHHITLLFKDDVRTACESLGKTAADLLAMVNSRLSQNSHPAEAAAASPSPNPCPSEFADLGLGRAVSGQGSCWFKVVFWPAACLLRRELGLSEQHFHMSCGFQPGPCSSPDLRVFCFSFSLSLGPFCQV